MNSEEFTTQDAKDFYLLSGEGLEMPDYLQLYRNVFFFCAAMFAFVCFAAGAQCRMAVAQVITQKAPSAEESPKKLRNVQALVFHFDGCVHCARLHADIDKTLVPLGWVLGTKGDIDFVDIKSADKRAKAYGPIRAVPLIILIDPATGKEISRSGGISAKKLSEVINLARQG